MSKSPEYVNVVDPDIHPLERIKQWTEQIEKNNGSAFCHSLSTRVLVVHCVRDMHVPMKLARAADP